MVSAIDNLKTVAGGHTVHEWQAILSTTGYFPYISSKVTAPQDAHGRLVLQVYLGSNTLEFSAICR